MNKGIFSCIVFLLPFLLMGQQLPMGQALAIDESEAVYIFSFKELKKKAKKEGGTFSMLYGDAYRRGINTEKDEKKAFKIYEKAALNGHAPSMHRLYHMLRHGIGCERNITESMEWLFDSANNGYAVAQHDIGYIYYIGEKVLKNWKVSEEYFLKMASLKVKNGSKIFQKKQANAQLILGKIYQDDTSLKYGVNISVASAKKWLEMSGRGEEYLKYLQLSFSSLESLKREIKRSSTYLPNVDIDIDFSSFQEVDLLCSQLENKHFLLGKNVDFIKRELGELVLELNYPNTKFNNQHRYEFVNNFNHYDWLSPFKFDWSCKLEKDCIREFNLSELGSFNEYFERLEQRKKLYSSDELKAINKVVFPVLNAAITEPKLVMAYQGLINNRGSWLCPFDSKATISFQYKFEKAIEQNAKDILLAQGIEYNPSELIKAIHQEDTTIVALFITAGVSAKDEIHSIDPNDAVNSIDGKGFDGTNYINVAARFGSYNSFRKLFSASPYSHQWSSSNGKIPLFVAISNNSSEIVEFLLSKQHDQFDLDRAMLIAAENDRNDILKSLISKGANCAVTNNKGISVLDILIPKNNLEVIDYLFQDCEFSEEQIINALNIACKEKNIDIIQRLVNQDINLNKPLVSIDYPTVLFQAVKQSHYEAIDLLLSNGADISYRNSLKENVLSRSIRGKNMEMVKYLTAKGLIGEREELIQAILTNDYRFVNFLLSKGTPPNYPDIYDHSPMQIALGGTTEKILNILKEYGAQRNQYDIDEEIKRRKERKEAERRANFPQIGDYACIHSQYYQTNLFGRTFSFKITAYGRVLELGRTKCIFKIIELDGDTGWFTWSEGETISIETSYLEICD